jgi:hypothetical protein
MCVCVLAAGKRALKRVTPILGGFSREDYTTERLWATATDGTEVSGSLINKMALSPKHLLFLGSKKPRSISGLEFQAGTSTTACLPLFEAHSSSQKTHSPIGEP